MIKSMTGYGNAKGIVGDLNVVIELKSVNNRYLDVSIHAPRGFIFVEETIKNAVQQHLSRGKVDVFISVDSSKSDDLQVKINEPLLKSYLSALHTIEENYGLDNDVSAGSISRYPDVLSLEKKELDVDAVAAGMAGLVEQALSDFDSMRQREGQKLHDDILNKVSEIERLLSMVEQLSPQTIAEYKDRLYQKMREVLEDTAIDEARIVQEVAIYSDKIAIDEETVRLHSHISQLKSMLEQGSPIGRKMDFLIQEFNREANTIGSKCQNSDIAHHVVDMKSEIEKMREQVQNIE